MQRKTAVVKLGLAMATALGLAASTAAADAQVVSCSKFLHNRDGSWSSFVEADVLGDYGIVHIHPGERFRRSGPRALADLARILDGMCESE